MYSLQTNEKHPRTYTIAEAGLRIQSLHDKNLPSEKHVPFENIKRDKFHHTERSSLFILTGGIFLFLWVLIAVSSSPKDTPHYYFVLCIVGLVGISSFISYFLFRQRFYFVKTFSGAYIRFRIDNNAGQINEFVKKLIAKRDEYLKTRYGKPNLHLSYDAQFSNFHIMHREGILSTEELESNLAILNSMFGQTTPTSRFLGYSQN